MDVIVSGGEEYVPITQETYDRFLAAQEESEKARYIAVENFRLWCEANKGTTTVEEGLKACTVDELYSQFYAAGGYSDGCIGTFVYALRGRLLEREKARTDALSSLQVVHIMPDDDEEVGNGAADNN